MRRIFAVLTLAIFLQHAGYSAAEGTQTWIQHSYDDFAKGNAKGVALRSSGVLELAPAFNAVFTSPSSFIWDIVATPDGTIYAAAGAPARVYRIAKDGSATVIFEPKELQVQALALDKNGVLYAATSPDGKIYRIVKSVGTAAAEKPKATDDSKSAETPTVPVDASYSATVFFEPKTKYIWDLAFGPDGRLFAATGDRGEIYAVTTSGEGKVFFKSDEAHIRKLAFDSNGTLYAGSDGSGLIYRISPAGEGFVLFSASKKEITALAFAPDGALYAAAVGEKRGGPQQPQMPGMPILMQPPLAQAVNMAIASPMISMTNTGGSEVYRISADGSPKRMWSNKDDIVYALAFDGAGRLLSGSGNKGRILALDVNGEFTELAKASATQVTGFAASGGALFATTSNLGKTFRLGGEQADGSFESDVFDARLFTQWGRVEVRGRSTVEFYARSGNVDNPDRNWSAWQKIALTDGDGKIEAPSARFLQWKAVFQNTEAQLDSVKVYYRSKNAAPVVEDVAVQAGARFNVAAMPRQQNDSVMVNVGPQQPQPQMAPNQPRVEPPLSAQKDRAFVAVRWAATDENGDDLMYTVYYRGDGESRWKLLKDKITDKFYSFDSSLLPDGGYQVRVVATDAPSHTPEEAISDFRDSERFEVDNFPPRIDGLAAKVEGGKLRISFSAADTFSSIQHAEFAIDAGEWQFVEPVGRISDARSERYDFSAALPKQESAAFSDAPKVANGKKADEHVLVVRVFDRFDNMAIAKVVVR